VVDDHIRLAVEKPFPRSGYCFEMKVQLGCWTIVEETTQQGEHFPERARITDDDAKLTFLSHRELAGVIPQDAKFMQEDTQSGMERFSFLRQACSIGLTVQQTEPELVFEILHRSKDR